MASGTWACAVANPVVSKGRATKIWRMTNSFSARIGKNSEFISRGPREIGSKKQRRGRLAPFADLGSRSALCRHRLCQVRVDLVEERCRREPFLLGADEEREVLGHLAGLDRVDAHPLQRGREFRKLRVIVELGAVREAARPGEDRGHRVGRGLLALLVLAVVAGHRAPGRRPPPPPPPPPPHPPAP